MNVGVLFYLIAVVLFFCLTVGLTLFPGQLPAGLCCLTLGLLTGGYQLPVRSQG